MGQGEKLRAWVMARPETKSEICRQAGIVMATLSRMCEEKAWSQAAVDGLRSLGCPEDVLESPFIQCPRCKRWVAPGKITKTGKCRRCIPREKASKIDGVETRLALRDPWADGTFQGPYGVHVNDILVCPWR